MFNKGSFFIPSWQAPFFFESPSHSLFIARISPAIIARFSVRVNRKFFHFFPAQALEVSRFTLLCAYPNHGVSVLR
jgi:hypothetical protein